MTLTAHLITGTALGVISMPKNYSKASKTIHMMIFAILADIPDWPIRNWGHDRYYFSHSVFVNLVPIFSILFIFLFIPKVRNKIGGWPVLFAGAIAWLSHMLLDSFYNHGYGIRIFWPYSEARLILPIPWFVVTPGPALPVTPEKLREVLLEFVSFIPLVVLAVTIRKTGITGRLKGMIAGK